MNKEILGIDVAGVIISKANDNTDTSFFGNDYLGAGVVPGTFPALQRLVRERFGDKVYIISTCDTATQFKTWDWMRECRLHKFTGINPRNIRFCREQKQKARICEKLGITHFIGNKLEVLDHLTTVEHRYLFQADQREVERHMNFLTSVYLMSDWEMVLGHLLV